jgi:hypothetical protein
MRIGNVELKQKDYIWGLVIFIVSASAGIGVGMLSYNISSNSNPQAGDNGGTTVAEQNQYVDTTDNNVESSSLGNSDSNSQKNQGSNINQTRDGSYESSQDYDLGGENTDNLDGDNTEYDTDTPVTDDDTSDETSSDDDAGGDDTGDDDTDGEDTGGDTTTPDPDLSYLIFNPDNGNQQGSFSVNLALNAGDEELIGVDVRVEYDGSVEFVSGSSGDVSCEPDIIEQDGYVDIVCLFPMGTPFTGSGVLATLQFNASGSGSIDMNITDMGDNLDEVGTAAFSITD